MIFSVSLQALTVLYFLLPYHPFGLSIGYPGDFSLVNFTVKWTKVGSMVLPQLLDELMFCPYFLVFLTDSLQYWLTMKSLVPLGLGEIMDPSMSPCSSLYISTKELGTRLYIWSILEKLKEHESASWRWILLLLPLQFVACIYLGNNTFKCWVRERQSEHSPEWNFHSKTNQDTAPKYRGKAMRVKIC